MDGGGNDILIPAIAFDPYDCKTDWYQFGRLSSTCKNFINDIYIDAVDFLNDVHADGWITLFIWGTTTPRMDCSCWIVWKKR